MKAKILIKSTKKKKRDDESEYLCTLLTREHLTNSPKALCWCGRVLRTLLPSFLALPRSLFYCLPLSRSSFTRKHRTTVTFSLFLFYFFTSLRLPPTYRKPFLPSFTFLSLVLSSLQSPTSSRSSFTRKQPTTERYLVALRGRASRFKPREDVTHGAASLTCKSHQQV